MGSRRDNQDRSRRRGVVRTVFALIAVVSAIYLAFVGRAALNYFGA